MVFDSSHQNGKKMFIMVDNLRQGFLFTECSGEIKLASLAHHFGERIKVFKALLDINKRYRIICDECLTPASFFNENNIIENCMYETISF